MEAGVCQRVARQPTVQSGHAPPCDTTSSCLVVSWKSELNISRSDSMKTPIRLQNSQETEAAADDRGQTKERDIVQDQRGQSCPPPRTLSPSVRSRTSRLPRISVASEPKRTPEERARSKLT